MLELAQLQAKDHVLDVGTGTGLVALRAGSLARNGHVVGIDHSSGMLEQASAKARRSGLAEIVTFQRMDAEQLEFSEESFDVVLSLYALFHFPKPLVALREMHRVMRSGGRVVIGVGVGPSPYSWTGVRQGARLASQLVAAARGRLLVAPHFLMRLMREHGMPCEEEQGPKVPPASIGRMLQEAGFKGVHQRWQGHCEALDPEEFWCVQATYESRARIRLQHASPQEIAALRNELFERCRSVQARRGKLVYPHAAMFYLAIRP
jgi:SAM-dependent methyltransferase